MTARHAMKHAYGQAYAVMQELLDGDSDLEIHRDAHPEDFKKVCEAVETLVQRFFDKSNLGRSAVKSVAGIRRRKNQEPA